MKNSLSNFLVGLINKLSMERTSSTYKYLSFRNNPFLYFMFRNIFDKDGWIITIKKFSFILLFIIVILLAWRLIISAFVAPFYSQTVKVEKMIKIDKYPELEGKTTVMAMRSGLQEMLNRGLVVNFFGVNKWIDNRINEEIGQLEIFRVATNVLENNLARNRGTGGANKFLVQSRSELYADYELSAFTSYTTMLKRSLVNMDRYLLDLEKNKNTSETNKTAVFIVNSDNLAEALDKIKQLIQTNLSRKITCMSEDDKFYKIKGNLLATYYVLEGIDFDFKNKMIDKGSYNENFIPIKEAIIQALKQDHLVIMESLGHVSKIENEANVICQKLTELRDKLRKG